jgi:hypothetical protein
MRQQLLIKGSLRRIEHERQRPKRYWSRACA